MNNPALGVDPRAYQRVQEVLHANLSPRYIRLDRLEQYVEGTQYDGRPSWWNDSVPLFDRAPCVVPTIVDDAIGSYVDLVLGEGRFPTITCLPGEEEAVAEDDLALSESDAEALDRGVLAALKQANGDAVLREMYEEALACGTAVVIGCVRYGRLSLETAKAKWCTRKADPRRPERVTSLEIRYPYIEEQDDKRSGRKILRVMIYRRTIDELYDTTYKPALANRRGTEPSSWTIDTRIAHGLGFCPVVWYAHRAKCSTVAEIDGRAIHGKILDEIDALCFAVSQMHRAALYASDPQYVETGVDEMTNPGPMGAPPASIYQMPVPGVPQIQADHPGNLGWVSPGVQNTSVGTQAQRKKGPGVIYRYPSKDSDLKLLTLPGDALNAADNNLRNVLTIIREALAYVSTDPETMKLSGDLSGRFMEWLHRKQLNRCDQERVDVRDHCILPVVHMLLRIALAKADNLHLPGVKKLAPIVGRFIQPVEQPDGSVALEWFPPDLYLRWPPYFAATEADQKAQGENVRADLDAGIITKKVAVQKVANYYGIKSVEEHLEALAADERERAESLHSAVASLKGDGEPLPEQDDAEAVPDGPASER